MPAGSQHRAVRAARSSAEPHSPGQPPLPFKPPAGGREGGRGAGQLRRWARQVLPALPRRAPRRQRFPERSGQQFASLPGSSPLRTGSGGVRTFPLPFPLPCPAERLCALLSLYPRLSSASCQLSLLQMSWGVRARC